MAKKYDNSVMRWMAQQFINAQGNPMEKAARKMRISPIYTEDGSGTVGYNWGDINPTEAQMAQVEGLQDKFATQQDISNGVSIPQLGQLGVGAIAEHPFKSLALGGSIAGNIGGLMDNKKIGGQLGGLALGGLGAYALNSAGVPISPYMMAMMTSGGGNLGALFDKLRARKEQEQAQPYYGGR